MNGYEEIFSAVFCNVFEQLAFMFGETCDAEECESTADSFIRAYMTFSGDREGSLEMILERDMCSIIASNVLGVNPEDEKALAMGTDSVKEMLNVICGQALTEIAGEEPIFNLSVPETNEIKANDWKKSCESGTYQRFLMDDMPVLCRMLLK